MAITKTKTKCFNQFDQVQLKEMGLDEDYIFQTLAYMGNAAHQMAWATMTLHKAYDIPVEIKNEMLKMIQNISDVQELLRENRKRIIEEKAFDKIYFNQLDDMKNEILRC
ncbi:hypothetical protein MKZ08_15420 [Viridibacillus sp. FSL R5-0477]|uniref:Uncharacterized protein n=1 Tax=Viridibacillus arenosi FSL R5-213 TaxID=1227360 RepID=W4EKH3_9BACL|nr:MULTISPECIES: hypothetical protein [Viridibacillus]ETT81060.1 hypothetical protein C176_20179 [Viridibacillus arenosi FSL R5-213]OMC88536.1 hypothetical protein BK128_00920 [Viridibacillus sp. FSL H7-0596]OMC93171.1 hypothetical protein BK137_01225 [Viridibacillus arenosi]